ncbi:MAG TPA: hypothetical protein VGB64_06785 [Actinomycetota bacterium]
MDTVSIVRRYSTAGFVLAALSGTGLAVAGFAEDPDRLPLGALAVAPAVFFLGAIPFVLYRMSIRTPATATWAGAATLFFTGLIHLMTHIALVGSSDRLEMLGFLIAAVWGAVVVGGANIAETMSVRRET